MAFARINDARLWYEVRGSGPVLLLHHGYTASRENWLPVADRLVDRFTVILMECRGAGESEHTPGGYNIEQYSADVLGLLDHLEIASVTFAGHSMGGGIGYRLALNHADRLEGLVLVAPVPADGTAALDPAVRDHRRRIRKNKDREAMMDYYRAVRFRPDVETDHWFQSRVNHIFSVSEGHYEDSAVAMRNLKFGSRLPELTTPTLMIAGAVDSLLESNLQDFVKLPNAVLQVFSRAGHEVAIHESEGVARAISEFSTHGVITSETLKQAALRGAG